MELCNAYNLIRIKEGYEYLTAFDTRYGKFKYTVIPFGLFNAGVVFSKFMNHFFSDVIDKFVVLYLVDILIYSEDESQHEEHV